MEAGLGVVDAAVGAGAAGLVLVPPGGEEVDDEVCQAEPREEPVEFVELPLVEVVGDPGPAVGRELVDRGHQGRADEEAQRERAEEQPRAHRLHPFGALPEEEIQLPDVGEGLPRSDEEELRDQPEDRHGHDPVGGRVLAGDPEAADLGEGGSGHGEDGEHEPHPDPLERGEPVRVAREAAGDGDDDAVVDGDREEDGADEEDGEGARRDLELGDSLTLSSRSLHSLISDTTAPTIVIMYTFLKRGEEYISGQLILRANFKLGFHLACSFGTHFPGTP